MTTDRKPPSAGVNGRLWGMRASDWAEIQEGTVRPVYEAVFNHVGLYSGMQYLDAGCGAGMAAQIAAGRGASVHGLDAADELLDIARTRTPAGDFRLGEIEELPFASDSFDLVTGFNSFQYAANPVIALTEARRVAKPGAMVVVMTWGKPEGMPAAALLGALRPLMPPPPPGTPGPFALSDETALRAFATSAGLEPTSVMDVDSPWQYPDLETALRGLVSSGNVQRTIENTSETTVREAYAAALVPFRQPDGGFYIGATFRCLFARA